MPEIMRPISSESGRFVQQTPGILFELQATDYIHQTAAQSEARVFDNPNTGIVGSNFTWGMVVCPHYFCFESPEELLWANTPSKESNKMLDSYQVPERCIVSQANSEMTHATAPNS
jgi:hypothetical protein